LVLTRRRAGRDLLVLRFNEVAFIMFLLQA